MNLNKNLIKKIDSHLVIFTITFLFFFQLVGILIKSIYALDLLNLQLDEKVLGVLFLVSPFFLLILKEKIPNFFQEIVIVILVSMRIITPLVPTSIKIITAGLGVACFLLFFSSYFSRKSEEYVSVKMGISFASSILLSILFRSMNATVDLSTYGWFQIIGWGLGALVIVALLTQLNKKTTLPKSIDTKLDSKADKLIPEKEKKSGGIIFLCLGLTGIILLNYFAYSSPTVISRWTNGSYLGITLAILIVLICTILILALKPEIVNKLDYRIIGIWNLLFVIALVLSISIHTFPFPANTSSDPVTVKYLLPWYFYLPLGIMIGLLPIIFIDFTLLSEEMIKRQPTLKNLGMGFGLGGLFFIITSLILIFTNVWGYVEPVSNLFRNLFWLPFLMVGIAILAPIFLVRKRLINFNPIVTSKRGKLRLASFLALILIGTTSSLLIYEVNIARPPDEPDSLKIMTYNIQQGVDSDGEMAYDKQLAVIKSEDPDIIGLQESDTARISGENSDVVRYFASHLPGYYYSFYGPRTVTGTYGAAVLSKYPIISMKTFFTYSDEDEIGTTQVVISVGDKKLNVFINHPAGSDDAKLAHMKELMNRVNKTKNVISMGDFNTREDTKFYNMSVATLEDSWRVANPTAKLSDRIDYIFVSKSFTILDSEVIKMPKSHSDHHTYWTEIEL